MKAVAESGSFFAQSIRSPVRVLSGGEKNRLLLAKLFAKKSNLLIMDEPTNGLDIPSKSLFRKVVAQNMTEDSTLIISTHQVHDIESLLDHIVILDNSQILVDSSVADITGKYCFRYRNPQDMEGVLYAEPSLQGNAAITLREADEDETTINLELFFNAATKGMLK